MEDYLGIVVSIGVAVLLSVGSMVIKSLRRGKGIAKQVQQDPFSDSVVRMLALMVAADGTVDDGEVRTVAAIMSRLTGGKPFPEGQARQLITAVPQDREAFLSLLRQNAARWTLDQRRMILMIGMEVSAGDGHVDESEQRLIMDAAHAMGLDASEVNLVADALAAREAKQAAKAA